MSWVKLDDQFFMDPVIRGLSKDAKLMYLGGLCYCASQLTDGHIDEHAAKILATTVGVKVTAAAQLVNAGVWEQDEDGFQVRSYLKYNPSAEQVKADREAARERQKRRRSHGVTRDVTNGVNSEPPSRPVPSLGSQVGGGGSPGLGEIPATTTRKPPDLYRAACRIIAERIADSRPRDDRERYVAATVAGLMSDHEAEAQRLLGEDGWTAETLADALAPNAPTGPALCPDCGDELGGNHTDWSCKMTQKRKADIGA